LTLSASPSACNFLLPVTLPAAVLTAPFTLSTVPLNGRGFSLARRSSTSRQDHCRLPGEITVAVRKFDAYDAFVAAELALHRVMPVKRGKRRICKYCRAAIPVKSLALRIEADIRWRIPYEHDSQCGRRSGRA
jgi:hypothetical protein